MPDRPNILFLFSDEHSFRCMGHAPDAAGEPVDTPSFDRLASRGTVFRDAYCQMPLCTPSRLCTLTGREVRGAGAWTNRSVMRPDVETLPGTLAAGGYETCLVGKMHLGGNRQFVGFRHRPYGDLQGFCGHQWEPIDDPDRHSMRARTAKVGVTGIPESLIQDEIVCHESLAWLREHRHARGDQPWFLCASFSRPHFPLTAPRRWFDRYWPDGVTPPKVGPTGDAYDHPMSVGMRRGFQADAIGEAEMMRARAAYFACVSYLDEVIGDFFARAAADGLLDNTVIVYSTDHGELAGEHGVWWKNGWYDGCCRVPLIVSTPAQRRREQPAGECTTPVALVDLFPTFCSLAGVDCPDDLDGRDLGEPVLGRGDAPDRPVFSDSLTPRWGEGTEFRSVRWRQWKYVRFRDAEPLMFDLAADPGEQHNLLRRGCEGDAAAARAHLADVAEETMDFDAAERERTERDGGLAERFKQDLPRGTMNQYLMPSGKLVNADDPLYNPTVLADRPEDAFSDYPGS